MVMKISKCEHKICYNSSFIGDMSKVFAPDGRLWCDSNLPQSDRRCHGKLVMNIPEFEQKVDYCTVHMG